MSDKNRLSRVTASYAACHFVVDLACVATMMGVAGPFYARFGAQERALAVVAYDMLAFCLQLPLGALMDVLGRARMRSMALLSFALVALGVLAGCVGGPLFAALAVLLVALGNALFHCVGGVEVLGESEGKAAPAGEFISTGALGVFLGSLPALNEWAGTPVLLLALLAGCACLILRVPQTDGGGGLAFALARTGAVAVALLAATVALRSYTGMVMAFPWKTQMALAVCAICAVVAGKALGGRLADRIGLPLASLVSLGGAAPLFLLSWQSPAAGIAATLLFNFTMAITLSALAGLLPQAKGMAFGIASFALAIGALPALLGLRLASPVVLCVLSVVSLVLLELGLACAKREAGEPS